MPQDLHPSFSLPHIDIPIAHISTLADAIREDAQVAGGMQSLRVQERKAPESKTVQIDTKVIWRDLQYILTATSQATPRPGLELFQWRMGNTDVPSTVWLALAENARTLKHLEVIFGGWDGDNSSVWITSITSSVTYGSLLHRPHFHP